MTTDTTTTVQLTDAQLAQFTACGVIVVEGERCPECPEAGLQYDPRVMGNVVPCEFCGSSAVVAPELWRKLTEPCPRCYGLGRVSPPRDDPDYLNGPSRPCPNPDCVGGRQVVTLTATCPTCHGEPWEALVELDEGDFIETVCPDCDDESVVTLGRFTIRPLPVIAHGVEIAAAWMPHIGPDQHGQWFIWHGPNVEAGENPSTGRYDWKRTPIATLDPLPQPGQWAVQFEAVAP